MLEFMPLESTGGSAQRQPADGCYTLPAAVQGDAHETRDGSWRPDGKR